MKRPTRVNHPPIGSTWCVRMRLQMCDRSIITMDEYLLVRSDLRQFAIVPDHFIGDVERIVYENDRFAVVAKREGMPADVARDENPRG